MNFSCLRENLKNGLNAVGRIAGKNINLPILNNIKIEAKNGEISLTATDLEMGIIDRVRGKVEVDGNFTVDAKIFTEYLNLLPNKKISLIKQAGHLAVECDNYKTKIKGLPAEEFPLIPVVEKKEKIEIPEEIIKKMLSQVLFAVASGDSRLELSGVFFQVLGDNLVLAATDSYRLAEIKINKKDFQSDLNVEKSYIIPAKTLAELLRILSAGKSLNDKPVLRGYFSENQVLFVVGQTELVSRLIEGQYPDYKQIIPALNKTKAIINRAEFIRASKVAALFSKTGINDISLEFLSAKKKLIITATSGQTGEQRTEISAAITGQDNGLVLNYRYLLDGLNNLNDEDIILELVDGNTPCTLRCANQEGYTYLIMPIKQ